MGLLACGPAFDLSVRPTCDNVLALLSQVELRSFEIVKTIMTGELPEFWGRVWPKFQRRLPCIPDRDSAAASAVVPHVTSWCNIFDERLNFLVELSRDAGVGYPGISACMCIMSVGVLLLCGEPALADGLCF